jgi:exodeoxyribonuclease V alpha subunit
MTEIRGQIERITYFNEENGYTIAKMRVQGHQGLVTIVGTLLGMNAGEVLRLKGDWTTHPRYGEQFKFASWESVIPATVEGIERYLSSGMIKGIGPVMARRLTAKFGAATLEVIEQDADRLRTVEGIGEKRIEMICRAWQEQKDIREVMVFLQGNGVSPAYAVKIFKQYGPEAISVVRENPYRLAEEVFGIGFIIADKIAEKLGVEKDSPTRARAGMLFILGQLADEGHVYFPFDPLADHCEKVLEMDRGVIVEAMREAAADGKIIVEDMDVLGGHGDAVFLASLHVCESGVAQRLRDLLNHPKQLPLVNKEQVLESAQEELKIELSEHQLRAVRESIDRKVMVVTGGPGTGKTTIIKSIIRVHEAMGQQVLLAAPTGRAAKRMFEAAGHEARTIHRLLEFSPRDGKFKRYEDNPLDADLIVIDEASMVDTVLMYHLLKAVPLSATLILVGDVDQLPSVGPGNVLRDIIDSRAVPTIRLNDIFRQSKESMIVVNAHRVNDGQMPDLKAGADGMDFQFEEVTAPEAAVERIISLCRETIPAAFGCNALNDIQVLTPMHRGSAGAMNLNTELQRQLNPSKDEFVRLGKTFKTGDKVMQIRNNYDKDVYNGDIGRIVKIDREEQEIHVDIDGRIIGYDFSELDELVLAYACSVHKSQGSEYPCVVMPVLTQHYLLLQRNLLYTGITRGKRLVVLVGTKRAVSIAVRNNRPQLRYTLLKERLRQP